MWSDSISSQLFDKHHLFCLYQLFVHVAGETLDIITPLWKLLPFISRRKRKYVGAPYIQFHLAVR